MVGTNPMTFLGGAVGPWIVSRVIPIAGQSLPVAERVALHPSHLSSEVGASEVWRLRGTHSHARYAERAELNELTKRQSALCREEARYAALIPVRKSADWWALSQDERRRIFESESRHIATSVAYLPAISRRLYHSRDLGEAFDFLTWFEFAPENEAAFNELLAKLRSSQEWRFVDREVDIRLVLSDDRRPGRKTEGKPEK